MKDIDDPFLKDMKEINKECNKENKSIKARALRLLGKIEMELDEIILLQKKIHLDFKNTEELKNIKFKLKLIQYMEQLEDFAKFNEDLKEK